jgi:SHS2 domain-containing protein
MEGAYEVKAELVGEAIDPGKHELEADVKAVTFHGLRAARNADGSWEAHVTVDV